ncbi:hypothetical protein BCR39DRAFT_530877 [Naematelia encephala]|uniref:Small nuclear ribonucleoprotein Prp3 C-terminal domain-containing protein n=1 Tax=Naematelia encephala TaxID=71784 RepID=A0A1Y2B4J9_9TREE|nr:hypothetical protein BCR39DRAFT_530877 [Naematelia encephala]
MSGLLEESLDTISILQAMYPLPTELEIGATTAAYLLDPSRTPPNILEIVLNLLVDEDEVHPLSIVIGLPVKSDDQVKISPRQPAWLNRMQHDSLLSSIPPCDAPDAILDTIESIKASASILLHSTRAPTPPPVEKVEEVLERVWFWFPSLSTREKRRDLVEYAPRYGLTGFVLAGKPGLLCLEGDAKQVDHYMSSIKSESWSDIPSHQKKVGVLLQG